jgi:hypothetical protein
MLGDVAGGCLRRGHRGSSLSSARCSLEVMNTIGALHCFPFMARRNLGAEEVAFNLPIFLEAHFFGLGACFLWYFAGISRERIDGGPVPFCLRAWMLALELVQILCQIREQRPSLRLQSAVYLRWACRKGSGLLWRPFGGGRRRPLVGFGSLQTTGA